MRSRLRSSTSQGRCSKLLNPNKPSNLRILTKTNQSFMNHLIVNFPPPPIPQTRTPSQSVSNPAPSPTPAATSSQSTPSNRSSNPPPTSSASKPSKPPTGFTHRLQQSRGCSLGLSYCYLSRRHTRFWSFWSACRLFICMCSC